VFLGFFFLWLFIVSEAPAINHTEKPMDFGFMNSVLRSRYFPPEDPWLAGHSISYYYFGHFMMAFLAKLTGVASSVGYNLALVSLPALVGIGSFGLVYNLVRLSGGRSGYQTRPYAIGFALMAPVLVMVIGNLEGVLEFVRLQGWASDGFWRWVGIKGLEGGVSTGSGGFPDQPWWWWRATRVIDTLVDGRSLDYTITEFPFFSFLLGDLHPHVMSLPFLLLNLSLGLNLFLLPDSPGLGWLRRHGWELGACALFLGALAFINLVDFPVFAAILGLILLVRSYSAEKGDLPRAAGNVALVLGPVVVAAVVMFLPFYLTFNSQASGIGRLGEGKHQAFPVFPGNGPVFLPRGHFPGSPVARAAPAGSRRRAGSPVAPGGVAGPLPPLVGHRSGAEPFWGWNHLVTGSGWPSVPVDIARAGHRRAGRVQRGPAGAPRAGAGGGFPPGAAGGGLLPAGGGGAVLPG
jgi:YYY domain-containing protein